MKDQTSSSSSSSFFDRDQAIQDYAHLVDKIARRIIARLPSSVELDDLKSVGIIGLIDAIEKYSDDKGNHFKVYAEIRIRGAIMDELRAQDWVPRSVRDRQNLIRKEHQRLAQKLGRTPSEQEVADGLKMTLEDFQRLSTKSIGLSMISYEDLNTRSDQSNRDILESIPDHVQKTPDSILEEKDDSHLLYQALKQLPERQRMVLSLYYFEEMKLREIGELLGVTESRVSQIHAQAVHNLKPLLKDLN